MAVPARDVVRVEAAHLRRPVDDVLEDLVQRRGRCGSARWRRAARRWKNELLAPCGGRAQAPPQVDPLPALQQSGLPPRQPGLHGKGGARQEQRRFVVGGHGAAHWLNAVRPMSRGGLEPASWKRAFIAVRAHLAHESVRPVEPLLRPQPAHEGDAQVFPVEVSGEVEDVHFEERGAAAERRPHAAARHRRAPVGPPAVDDARPHRVDAERRFHVVAEAQVGGRKAERASAFVAVHHAPFDFPQVAQDGRGQPRLAALEIGADARRGIDLAGVADGVDHRHAEAVRRSGGGERGAVAAAPVAGSGSRARRRHDAPQDRRPAPRLRTRPATWPRSGG